MSGFEITSPVNLKSPSIITRDNFKFQIKQIIGTSAKSKQQISIQDDLIAYTASGGVVVNKINKQNNEVISQRFFCANNNISNKNDFDGVSSANAYLEMIKGTTTSSIDEPKRDLFGYAITNEPLVIYGNSFSSNDVQDNSPNNASSPSKLKDKVRSINCIAISPNKKLLAVGEIGYQPRVLIFSLAPDSQDSPIMDIYEHSFGVDKVVFSPDAKHLCSLGVINDGCINIWKLNLNNIILQASNRCSNIINKIIWHENLIITIGLRFIKIWNYETNNSTKPIVLKGRNAHLGILMNSNFIDMSVLNDDEILIVTSSNQLLLLKLNFDSPKLIGLKNPTKEFCSICVDYLNELIWLGGIYDKVVSSQIKDLTPIDLNSTSFPPLNSSPSKLHQKLNGSFETSCHDVDASKNSILQMFDFDKNHLILLNENEEIRFFDKNELKMDNILTNSIINNIGGIKKCYNGFYLIFSKDGLIKKLNDSCELESLLEFVIPGNEVITNTLTAIEHFDNFFVLGDKYGTLYIIEKPTKAEEKTDTNVIFQIKAHTSTINRITYFKYHDNELICTVSRDRTIQIFTNKPIGWDLLQTIPVHNGNVFEILIHENQLIACSSDRTISIHNITTEPELSLSTSKIITLKTTPVAMIISENELIVSTIDKQLIIYDLNYEVKRSMKLNNEQLNESLLVELMVRYQNLIIVSCADKSLRAFDYATGKPVGVTWGHSESLLGLFVNEQKTFISIGNDGCLFSWLIIGLDSVRPQSIEKNSMEEYYQPLYAKVARKILPSVPIKSTSTEESLNDKKEVNDLTNTSCEKLSKTSLISPNTPNSKLSSATLKRMEAKNSQTKTSPTRSRSVSPTRPSQSQKISSSSLPTTNTNRSPTRPAFNLNKSQNSINGLSKLNQPLSSPPPAKRTTTSPRSSIDLGRIIPHVQLNTTPTKSIFRHDLNPTKSNNSQVTYESAMKFMNNLIENSSNFENNEKRNLLNKIEELKSKLNGIPYQNSILEDYSNKLVELVEQKLNLNKSTNSPTTLVDQCQSQSRRESIATSNYTNGHHVNGTIHDEISMIIASNAEDELKEINTNIDEIKCNN
ncbi:uncharacterized protein KGF55_002046 [Candida pseudojiufengensis]|uniref:uncharacterized protein n=1 Tax=Candida pseudojiufengensis TaxID=497109 RepID=UPI002224BAE3|nr:uncharacterized protein KGF55_002046 [Candida pseudojiufengensis]KAI5964104.1 hypothetical protein KGF55_002046 [Candida pseudojiufengensis]